MATSLGRRHRRTNAAPAATPEPCPPARAADRQAPGSLPCAAPRARPRWRARSPLRPPARAPSSPRWQCPPAPPGRERQRPSSPPRRRQEESACPRCGARAFARQISRWPATLKSAANSAASSGVAKISGLVNTEPSIARSVCLRVLFLIMMLSGCARTSGAPRRIARPTSAPRVSAGASPRLARSHGSQLRPRRRRRHLLLQEGAHAFLALGEVLPREVDVARRH